MKRESQVIFAISIVLTLGIVGGAHYLYLQGQKRISNLDAAQPEIVIGTEQAKRATTQPATRRTTGRTSTPIKCIKSDGTVFWTNAVRCEDADLNNKLSYADPVKPVPRVKRINGEKNSPSRASRSSKKTLKSIPAEMTVACSFPIGMARKIETRSLSLKRDPAESIWKDSYCRWVCEARVENCEELGNYLNFVRICPWRPYLSKRACGA